MDADLSMPDARLRRMPPLRFARRSIARRLDTRYQRHQARAIGNGHQSGRHRHTSPSSAPLASSSQRHICMAADPENPGRPKSAAALASTSPTWLSIPGPGHPAHDWCLSGGIGAAPRPFRRRNDRAGPEIRQSGHVPFVTSGGVLLSSPRCGCATPRDVAFSGTGRPIPRCGASLIWSVERAHRPEGQR
jgi:hypothetical protein